jgi:hypothetical protein
MPAKDKYHDTVVRALEKEGWVVTSQYEIVIGERRLWIDIRAAKESERIAILIEVKGFEGKGSQVEYLTSAVGQYVVYRAIIESSEGPLPLYLAVPLQAYEGIFAEPLGQLVVQNLNIVMIVFDPEHEEIVVWKT